MNAKTLLFVVAIAASANVFAGNGRDSVYAQPDAHTSVATKSIVDVQGRSSVYASDLPAPTPVSERTAVMAIERFGRA